MKTIFCNEVTMINVSKDPFIALPICLILSNEPKNYFEINLHCLCYSMGIKIKRKDVDPDTWWIDR